MLPRHYAGLIFLAAFLAALFLAHYAPKHRYDVKFLSQFTYIVKDNYTGAIKRCILDYNHYEKTNCVDIVDEKGNLQ